MKDTNQKSVIPFLYYVHEGVCKSNREMPASSESFTGWKSATHILRNQGRHSAEEVKLSLKALKNFLKKLSKKHVIKEKDLLKHVKGRK